MRNTGLRKRGHCATRAMPLVNYKTCSFLKAVASITWRSASICPPFKEEQDYTQLYVQGRADICTLDFRRQRWKKGRLPEGENRKQKEMIISCPLKQ